MILVAASYAFTEAPLLWLYESMACKEYYRVHDPSVIGPHGAIPEEKCKLDAVQQEVAKVTNQQVLINGIICTTTLFSNTTLYRIVDFCSFGVEFPHSHTHSNFWSKTCPSTQHVVSFTCTSLDLLLSYVLD